MAPAGKACAKGARQDVGYAKCVLLDEFPKRTYLITLGLVPLLSGGRTRRRSIGAPDEASSILLGDSAIGVNTAVLQFPHLGANETEWLFLPEKPH